MVRRRKKQQQKTIAHAIKYFNLGRFKVFIAQLRRCLLLARLQTTNTIMCYGYSLKPKSILIKTAVVCHWFLNAPTQLHMIRNIVVELYLYRSYMIDYLGQTLYIVEGGSDKVNKLIVDREIRKQTI